LNDKFVLAPLEEFYIKLPKT